MSFWMWPPEVNSVLLLEGPGSGRCSRRRRPGMGSALN
ncbi:PE-PGRS family domain protein [Mycobacterium kansasii]|uniref:PE-PGRS family domain protein n=1 Tax=Mycobacterium kansasii TaxID=1768 RepID=A0A1V3XW71_MYCKA|nr:PE-PGRS family domain protein [Mycobacterium kansasii]